MNTFSQLILPFHFQAYLSLPEGTASVAGLIAMMTDHYSVIVSPFVLSRLVHFQRHVEMGCVHAYGNFCRRRAKVKEKAALILESRGNIRSANVLKLRLVMFEKKLSHHIQLHQRKDASHF